MRIIDYPRTDTLSDNDVLVIDGEKGTGSVKVGDLGLTVPDPSWIVRRNTYRGKNLGSEFTQEQKNAISSGTFDDLYIGDYWKIQDNEWLIADINYWDGYPNHLAIVPVFNMYETRMNSTSSYSYGYTGCEMYLNNLKNALTTIKNIFGSNILTHSEVLVNAVANDGTSGSSINVDVEICLMTEPMIYGFRNAGSTNDGTQNEGQMANSYTIDYSQLASFRLNPKLIKLLDKDKNDYVTYWLRDVGAINKVVYIDEHGAAHKGNPVLGAGVRPVFGITG